MYKKGFYSWLYKGLDSKNCKTVNNKSIRAMHIRRKQFFAHAYTKTQISCTLNVQLISVSSFTTKYDPSTS